jgi:hypothetical protein
VALSGRWTSPATFELDYDEVGNINMFQMTLNFNDPQRLNIEVTERSEGARFTVAGAP